MAKTQVKTMPRPVNELLNFAPGKLASWCRTYDVNKKELDAFFWQHRTEIQNAWYADKETYSDIPLYVEQVIAPALVQKKEFRKVDDTAAKELVALFDNACSVCSGEVLEKKAQEKQRAQDMLFKHIEGLCSTVTTGNEKTIRTLVEESGFPKTKKLMLQAVIENALEKDERTKSSKKQEHADRIYDEIQDACTSATLENHPIIDQQIIDSADLLGSVRQRRLRTILDAKVQGALDKKEVEEQEKFRANAALFNRAMAYMGEKLRDAELEATYTGRIQYMIDVIAREPDKELRERELRYFYQMIANLETHEERLDVLREFSWIPNNQRRLDVAYARGIVLTERKAI